MLLRKLTERVIGNFTNNTIESVDDYIVPPGLFNIAKPIIVAEISFCTKNKKTTKQNIS